jgi:hypothetical protein
LRLDVLLEWHTKAWLQTVAEQLKRLLNRPADSFAADFATHYVAMAVNPNGF